MNLQEQNRMREKMRDLRIEHDRLAARVAELEALIPSFLGRVTALENAKTLRLPRK